jgi:hypothetical protein
VLGNTDRRRDSRPPATYWWQALPPALFALTLLGCAIEVPLMACPSLFAAGAWLLHAGRGRAHPVRADQGLPVHPMTLLATVAAGASAVVVAHAVLPFVEPSTAATPTSTDLYGIAASVLAGGYVVFAGGYRRDSEVELLPTVHAVGVWTGAAVLAVLGLIGALLGVAGTGGWFAFWAPVVSIPAFGAVVLARSGLLRGADLPGRGGAAAVVISSAVGTRRT